MRTAVSRQQRQWIVSALLIALFVRALIPAGFMPAMDRPLSFQICPDGYPAHLLRQGAQESAQEQHAHHHHHGAGAADPAMLLNAHDASAGESTHSGPHSHGVAAGEHCVFAAVAAVGPLAFSAAFVSFIIETSAREVPYVSPALTRERFLLPPSRGPPALS